MLLIQWLFLARETLRFIGKPQFGPDLLLPNSLDLNPVDYKI